jgi:hypothetical protein
MEQWRRPREGLRVPLLQPEACGEQGRLGHGHTAGAVLGATDCGGLS